MSIFGDEVRLIVPFDSDEPWRLRALDYVREWWQSAGLRLTTYSATHGGRWSKGASVLLGAEAQRHGEILIVADGDVLPPLAAVREAVAAVRRGERWVIPQARVRRLSQLGTQEVYLGARPDGAAVEYTHRAMAGGGLVVMRRETLLDVPMDPRFVGWGNEDEAWAIALTWLAGAPLRLQHTLTHLYHPRAERIDPWRGSVESVALRDRYQAARKDRPALRRIIDEFKGA